MKDNTVTKKDRDKELLTVKVGGGGEKTEGGDDDEEKAEEATATGTTQPTETPTAGATKGGIGLGGLGGKKEEAVAV